MTQPLVTRESLIGMLSTPNIERRKQIVGRALVAIFNRQTADEQQSNATNHNNGIGFAGADAYSGTLSAKSFLKNRTLLDWQLERWMKPNKNGVPRIAKYAEQLNKIAQAKAVST